MEDVLSLHASEEEEGSLSYQEETFHSNSSLDKLERESDTTSEPRFEALVERAARCLRVEWTPAKTPAHKRTLPSFPDFIKEVQLSCENPASAPVRRPMRRLSRPCKVQRMVV
ncbi:UNVERIFIED_CONTAM: hypothetical protein FKN15_003096 [Acipenser sinensis]